MIAYNHSNTRFINFIKDTSIKINLRQIKWGATLAPFKEIQTLSWLNFVSLFLAPPPFSSSLCMYLSLYLN